MSSLPSLVSDFHILPVNDIYTLVGETETRAAADSGSSLTWWNQGEPRLIPNAVLSNAIREYDQQIRWEEFNSDRVRPDRPRRLGLISWSQTVRCQSQ